MLEEQYNEMNEETRRFYLQQKSVKKECRLGSENCTTCKEREKCKIRQYVE